MGFRLGLGGAWGRSEWDRIEAKTIKQLFPLFSHSLPGFFLGGGEGGGEQGTLIYKL